MLRFYIATKCAECDELFLTDVCSELGHNPGTDGHPFKNEGEAKKWADHLNDHFKTKRYFVVSAKIIVTQ